MRCGIVQIIGVQRCRKRLDLPFQLRKNGIAVEFDDLIARFRDRRFLFFRSVLREQLAVRLAVSEDV